MSLEFNKEFFTTFGLTILNIVVLFIVLKAILFKPITKHMDKRTKKIEEALKVAEQSQEMVKQMKIEYDEKIKAAKDEGQRVTEMYRAMAEKEYNSIIASAKKEADRMVEEAKAELQVEKEQLITSLKGEISNLVLATSEKVLNKNLDNDTNKKLIFDFINDKNVS